jgi:hypothetical protein
LSQIRDALPALDDPRYTDFIEVNMPPLRATRRAALPMVYLAVCLFAWMPAGAQAKPEARNSTKSLSDFTGMYSFLNDGEYVQLTVVSEGLVTGFVSRYADASHEGGFLEQVFESGQLVDHRLTFTTRTAQGMWFEFHGTIERGEGKSRNDEGYYVLKGNLVENTIDDAKKKTSRSREVALQSFPQDLATPPAEKN